MRLNYTVEYQQQNVYAWVNVKKGGNGLELCDTERERDGQEQGDKDRAPVNERLSLHWDAGNEIEKVRPVQCVMVMTSLWHGGDTPAAGGLVHGSPVQHRPYKDNVFLTHYYLTACWQAGRCELRHSLHSVPKDAKKLRSLSPPPNFFPLLNAVSSCPPPSLFIPDNPV